MHLNATNFAKQTAAWLLLIDSFNSSLKELGDVESWARTIEGDMRAVSSTLEYSYKVNSAMKADQVKRAMNADCVPSKVCTVNREML